MIPEAYTLTNPKTYSSNPLVREFEKRLESRRTQVETSIEEVECFFSKRTMTNCLSKIERFAEMCEKLAQSAKAAGTADESVLSDIREELKAIREIKSDIIKNRSEYLCLDNSDKFIQVVTGFANNLTRAMLAEVEA